MTSISHPSHTSGSPEEAPLMIAICGDGSRLVVSGELDLATAPGLERVVGQVATDHDVVELDLSHITFMDSQGLRALLTRRSSTTVAIIAASEQVQRLLEIAGVTDLFEPPAAGDEHRRAREVLLALVADVAACDAATVTLSNRGEILVVAVTDHVARAAEAAQIDADSGPSLAAMRTRRTTGIDRIARGPGRFEEFKSAAASLGLGSVVAIPVRVPGSPGGAVTMYSKDANGFEASDEDRALLAAEQLAPLLGGVLAALHPTDVRVVSVVRQPTAAG